MERTTRKPQKSLSLGNRINKRRSVSIATTDDSFISQEPTSPSGLLRKTPSESTPPHKKFSLDESIEFSPTFLNSSFSPSTASSQAFENSEVSWKWCQKINNNNNERDSVLTDCNLTTAETKNKQLPRRQEVLRDIESKIRKAENTRTDEMLKQRCAKFRNKLLDNKNRTTERNVQIIAKEQKELPKPKATAATSLIEKTPPRNTIDDFFNDSDEDDFLLEATEKVELDIIRLTQKPSLTANNLPTPKSTRNHEEKRSSIYRKFLEDDMSDDVFESFDDIIENAMKDTKPKSSFQRFNSLPVESNSPKSKTLTKTLEISKNAQIITDSPNFKRHASCHDVPIYYPHKPKQARRT